MQNLLHVHVNAVIFNYTPLKGSSHMLKVINTLRSKNTSCIIIIFHLKTIHFSFRMWIIILNVSQKQPRMQTILKPVTKVICHFLIFYSYSDLSTIYVHLNHWLIHRFGWIFLKVSMSNSWNMTLIIEIPNTTWGNLAGGDKPCPYVASTLSQYLLIYQNLEASNWCQIRQRSVVFHWNWYTRYW